MDELTPVPASTTSAPGELSKSPAYAHPIVQKHAQTLEALQERVWNYLDRRHQLQMLHWKVHNFVDGHYGAEARQHLHATLGYIFEDIKDHPIRAQFTVPQRIGQLMGQKPCIFTFFPGLDTHQSISQYDITLGDRTSKVMSRSLVSVKTRLTADPRTEMDSFLVNAPMRGVVDPDFVKALVEEGQIVFYHRFRRPLNPADCDQHPKNHGGRLPDRQSQEAAAAERLRIAQEFGSRMIMACGVDPQEIEFAKRLVDAGALGICVDVALANSYQCAAAVLELKEYIADSKNPGCLVIPGNVDNEEGYFLMAVCGADSVKVGIGPGSNCTTRGVTGAGKGQGSALMSVARALFVYPGTGPAFIADGGLEGSVDVTRALALQARSGMSGKLFTKCFESGALKRDSNGKLMAWSFGEASEWAQIYSRGGVKPGCAVEGKGSWIPVEYHLREFLERMRAEWRNSLTYYNAASADELRAKFGIEQQLCDLIRGGETGIYLASAGISREAGTRMV